MPGKVISVDSSEERPASSNLHSYRIYTTDDYGTLSVSLPSQEAKVLLKVRSTPDNAVHKMARGKLQDSLEVLALARHSGQIDIVSSTNGKILLTVSMTKFKKGMHRWVGLAVARDGVFACSSAGDFTFTPLEVTTADEVVSSEITSRELPEPLKSVQFEPAMDPRIFAIGGETVPLSVWDVRKFITLNGTQYSDSSVETVSEEADRAELHGKARKRRRAMEKRVKDREMQPGEVWRAKNLPNSTIGLVNRPSISSIVFLEHDKLAVGTRQGHLQLYHIGAQRKPVREISLFGTDKNPIKLLSNSYSSGQLIAADNVGRVFVVDYTISKILYKYEMFAASALSLCPLPSLGSSSNKVAYLVTCSAEKLLRLHSLPMTSISKAKSKENGKIISTLFKPEGVRNVLWDGVIPDMSIGLLASEEGGESTDGEVVEENDDVWQEMAIVGDEEQDDQHQSQKRRV